MALYQNQNVQLLIQLCKTNLITQYGIGIPALLKILVKPVFVLFVFSLVFDKFIRIETGAIPYPIFAFIGLIVWEAFFASFVSSLNLLKQYSEILKNFSISVRLIQSAEMLNVFFESFVKIMVFNCICCYYGNFNLLHNLLLFTILMVVPILLGFGFGLYFVVADTRHKIIINNIPYFFGYLMWLTPVFFPETLIPEGLRFVVWYNPVAELIYFFRQGILGLDFDALYTGLPTLLFLLVAVGGFYLFGRVRYKLIEII